MSEPQFIPSVEIQFCGPDGEKHTRKLRFDLAARRVLRQQYPELNGKDPVEVTAAFNELVKADLDSFLVRALFALTYHERQDGETPESFEPFVGIHNIAYVFNQVRDAMGLGQSDEDEEANPTTAPNGSVKRSRTGKRSKHSPKSASESPQAASIQ